MDQAFLNGTLFYDSSLDLEELALTTAETRDMTNAAGQFTFTVPPQNIAFESFHRMKDYVELYEDDERVFSGRVYRIKQSLDGQIEVICEGMMAVLNDTVIRPFTFDDTLENLVVELIRQHNDQVSQDKQITVGTITVADRLTIVYREYENYASTMKRIEDLLDSFGGYMDVYQTSNGLVLDWLENYGTQSDQTVDLGSNILNITKEETSEEVCTVLIPLGSILEDEDGVTTNQRVTIASVNDGLDYIEADSEYISQYGGRIIKVKTWDDVNVPSILKTKAEAYLNSLLVGKVTIKVDVIDLADAGYDVSRLKKGVQVKVTSAVHGINGLWFEVTEIRKDRLHRGSNAVTLGSVQNGYVDAQRRQISEQANALNKITANYTTNVKAIREDLGLYTSNFESLIEQLPDTITTNVLEIVSNQYGEQIGTLEASTTLLSEQFTIWFGENGKINTWFEFDEDYFTIRKNGQSVYSRQDNDSYEFCDVSGNTLLLIDTNGMTAPTANVSGQIKFMQGDTGQWAIRKGAYVTGYGVNLDDVWIG